MGGSMHEFLTFRKMIAPVLIQIICWIGTAAAVIVGVLLLADILRYN